MLVRAYPPPYPPGRRCLEVRGPEDVPNSVELEMKEGGRLLPLFCGRTGVSTKKECHHERHCYMIKTTCAAVLETLGTLVIKDVELLELLTGQVLVKVLFRGVCRSQLMEVHGARGDDPWLPHLLGHEGSGIVVAVGDGVNKVKSDDEVILGWGKGEGLDAPGAKYMHGDQIINAGRVTTFSNYTIISESRVVKNPAGLSFDTAILFGCTLPTGAGMVLNELKPSSDSSVVVLGLGGIGLSALVALKAIGVKMIIAVDVSEGKLELAKQFGANHVFNSSMKGFPKQCSI